MEKLKLQLKLLPEMPGMQWRMDNNCTTCRDSEAISTCNRSYVRREVSNYYKYKNFKTYHDM